MAGNCKRAKLNDSALLFLSHNPITPYLPEPYQPGHAVSQHESQTCDCRHQSSLWLEADTVSLLWAELGGL